ncbi:MAG TPA: SIR2 family protein [Bryobacteraceae bacterium]|nr:SIR2 family protein [Bryobacteraceae bacterium]
MADEPIGKPLLTPTELAQNEKRKTVMVELFVSKEPVLIIGSGCSVRLKLSNLAGFAKEAHGPRPRFAADHDKQFLSVMPHDPQEYLRYADEIKRFINGCDGKLDKYYNLLSAEFGDRDIDDFHRLLVKLPSRGILTTNYDPSLDVALMQTDRSTVTADRFLVLEDDSTLRVAEFLASLNRDSGVPRRIAHLHGRFDRPKNIILTASDYGDKYHSRFSAAQRQSIRDVFLNGAVGPQAVSVEGLIDQLELGVPPWSLHRKLLWSILATRRVVFIGFGLNDHYLGQMLALVTDDLWLWKKDRHFAIMALPESGMAAAKSDADRFESKYAVGVVFYENREKQRHEGLNTLLEEIGVACGVSAEPMLDIQPPAKVIPVPAPVPRPDWINRNNQIMKKRATKDAD